jgi:crotonobetainyl-CoA:carnitine CoA-transferase CaiB-like acyl-CoA transferase
VPYAVFPTADGNIIIAVGNDEQFRRFCDFAGIPDVAKDERYAKNEARVRNRTEVAKIVADVMSKKPTAYWIEGLEKNKISCGPINTIDQVFADEQVVARDMAIEMPHPAAGGQPVKLIGSPIKMSGTPVTYRAAPPMMGQHTDDVLKELLGLDAKAVAELRAKGAI